MLNSRWYCAGGVLPQDVKELELARPPTPELRIPRSLAEVDKGQIMGFGADLAEDHPVRCCPHCIYKT